MGARLHRNFFLILVGVLCLQFSFSGSPLYAESTNATVTGRVLDPSNAIVVDAVVAAVNAGTNITYSSSTNAEGLYTLPNLPPGTYQIEISKPGFKTVIKPDVVLHVQDVVALNFSLPIGSVSESVTVTAETNLAQTETTTLGHVVDEKEVVNLPLVSRNYTQILALSPGVASDVTNASGLGRNSQDVFVSGMGSGANNFQMDGVEINNFGSNRAGESYGIYGGIAVPDPDTIQEFKVQTSLYDASDGRAVGANVNVVTKSGTNSFHGTVFEFFRNNVLNANDYFSNLNGQKRPVLRQNQFGGTFGGPILRNRLFFFGSYQGTRQANGVGSASFETVVLPPLTNDRSAATLGTQFCGQTGAFGGTAVACDGSNINPAALNLLNYKLANGQYLFPTPQVIQPDGNGFSVFSIPAYANEDQFLINADYALSAKHTLSERFFGSRTPETLPMLYGSLPGSPYTDNLQNRNLVLKLSSALSNTLFNEAKFGFVRNYTDLEAGSSRKSSDFGMTSANPAVPGLPELYVGNLDIENGWDAEVTVNNNFSGVDQFSWVHGRETIRAGFEVERVQFSFDQSALKAGGLTLLSFPDLLLGQSAAQNGTSVSNIYGDFVPAGDQAREMRATDWAAYFQDDIKVTSRLTLNAGLRWEVFGGVYDKHGRASDFWPQLANNDFSQGSNYTGFVVASNFNGSLPTGVFRNGNKTCCSDATRQNWEPRVGLSWRPLAHTDSLVVRVGYGMFSSRPAGNEVGPVLLGTPPYGYFVNNSGATIALATLQQPFNPAPPPDSDFPIFLPRTPSSSLGNQSVSPGFRSFSVQSFSLNVQRELLRDFLLEVGYVGSRGTRLNRFYPYNQASLASPQNPVNGETTNTLENVYLRVPNMGISSSSQQESSNGGSWYNALQVSLRKRFSRGLQFQASYTFDKSLDDVRNSLGSAGTHGGLYESDIHTPHAEWGPSDWDRPQRFVFSYVWELPIFHAQQGLGGKTLGGWSLSGVTTIQSGHRLTVDDLSSGSIVGAASGVPGPAQLCPGKTNADIPTHGSTESRISNYINANVFCAPPAIGDGNYFGNLGRGVFGGPDQNNYDIALAKRTIVGGLRENAAVDFRAEFFNAFNHPQFADPSSGCEYCGVGIPGFNQITGTSVAPRIIQFALKYSF